MTAIDVSAQAFASFRTGVFRIAHYGSEEQRPQKQELEQHNCTMVLRKTPRPRSHDRRIPQNRNAKRKTDQQSNEMLLHQFNSPRRSWARTMDDKSEYLHCVPADGETDIFYCLSTPPTRAATQRVHYRSPFRDVMSDDHTKSV